MSKKIKNLFVNQKETVVTLCIMCAFFMPTGCGKMELGEEMSDAELLRLAYDETYFYPNKFYKDPALPESSAYYVNTVSISPDPRDSKWIELSTNDKNEALMWVNLTIFNSSDRFSYSLIDEYETEKYFEFKYLTESLDSYIPYSYTGLLRVHKTRYYLSIFDRFQPWNHANETKYGYYNAEIEDAKVKECIEYLWVQTTFANLGQKVISSQIKETKDYFEVLICSLGIVYGDWGMHDEVSLYDNYIRLNKGSRLITFKQSLRRQLLGRYFPNP